MGRCCIQTAPVVGRPGKIRIDSGLNPAPGRTTAGFEESWWYENGNACAVWRV
jgi:hypothetical protein